MCQWDINSLIVWGWNQKSKPRPGQAPHTLLARSPLARPSLAQRSPVPRSPLAGPALAHPPLTFSWPAIVRRSLAQSSLATRSGEALATRPNNKDKLRTTMSLFRTAVFYASLYGRWNKKLDRYFEAQRQPA